MENRNEENENQRETVTLILGAHRFEVDKQNLIGKSQYFAALMSVNYLERRLTEHIVNYDVSPNTLQDFIYWIHNDRLAVDHISIEEGFNRLWHLLDLSILFLTNNLEKCIIDRLETHYMSPTCAVDIWKLSQDLSLNVLRDLSLAVCLDRFDELPLNSIYQLSKQNFVKLIGNTNIRATESYLFYVAKEWMNYHHDFTISPDILRNKETKILHGVISCEANEATCLSEQFIHCWDGKNFFELTSFKYPDDIIDCSIRFHTLAGMQIIARRHDLYLCGGEFGIGTGKFNKNVWRYSLISKKWHLETVMPVERRHMIAVFLNNYLVLVGGVGRYRKKLQSVDIYNIYTGLWTSGENLPWEFTTVPDHYVFDGKLIIYKCVHMKDKQKFFSSFRGEIDKGKNAYLTFMFYVYFPDENKWKTRTGVDSDYNLFSCLPSEIPMLTLKTLPCYIDIDDSDEKLLRFVSEKCDMEKCIIEKRVAYMKFENDVSSSKYLLHTEQDACLSLLTPPLYEYKYLNDLIMLVCVDSKTCTELGDKMTLHVHSISIQNQIKFRSFAHSPKRFFNLIHPDHLHTTNFYQIQCRSTLVN
ncbi:PREDICTED: uncharacterized protein LOC105457557 isoform X1 [Wasmannia auropunctata]|uniref:uncharacterized protein LOC105457557 isoform X1 n=1 Tax=Wasmannia auropunctata TaxID=64793 RepID=UPI0005EE13FC|nr:PREDICTED: uncharacterized protein LOC105457557 isoform X1 [Wasmannia auropunctata]XP_011700584.1 PREDICTED: uncharacterized protein LOC105457557 isoform X1 [Wasmannia auropunctata]